MGAETLRRPPIGQIPHADARAAGNSQAQTVIGKGQGWDENILALRRFADAVALGAAFRVPEQRLFGLEGGQQPGLARTFRPPGQAGYWIDILYYLLCGPIQARIQAKQIDAAITLQLPGCRYGIVAISGRRPGDVADGGSGLRCLNLSGDVVRFAQRRR